MATFEIVELEAVSAQLRVYKLIRNGRCEYDDFLSDINDDGNLRKQLNRIRTTLREMADGHRLPEKKLRSIQSSKLKGRVLLYEAKTQNLRLYMFHYEPHRRIIVCGGKKTTQQRDIKHFESIVSEFLDYAPG